MNIQKKDLLLVLQPIIGDSRARSLLSLGIRRAKVRLDRPQPGDSKRLLAELKRSARLCVPDPQSRVKCLTQLTELLDSEEGSKDTEKNTVVSILVEADIARARTTGRQICADLGFSPTEQTKIATVISELARNIYLYVGEGAVEISVLENQQEIEIVARDKGPGIENLETILSGDYRSKSGLGKGLLGTKRLMDEVDIATIIGEGTVVTARKKIK